MKKRLIRPEGDIFTTPRKGPNLYQHTGDFSAVLLGTGCPVAAMGRSHPSTLIQYKGHYFLVDVGEGTVLRLAEGGLPIGSIKNVLFTHHHADHNGGYPYFAVNSWMNGRDDLDLVGPPGTKFLHEGFVGYYDIDLGYRATLMCRPLETTYQANIREIEDKDTFELDGVTISTAKLTHTAHNLGYRFEVDGKVIVVSGDTTFDPALIELARDADLLVMDSGPLPNKGMIPAGFPSHKGPPPKEDPKNFAVPPHPIRDQVAQMAKAANVKNLLLTHYGPMLVDEEKAAAILKEQGYEGNVIFGRDLMEVAI